MDFQRFGIDARLAEAAEGLKIDFFFYEQMLSRVVEKQENVCAKIALSEGREEVLLLPALKWILSGESRKALVVVPDSQSGDRCARAVERLGSGAGIETCRVDRASLAEGGPESPVFEGDPSSSVVIGKLSDLIVACPPLDLKEYGFLVVDGADRLAELPPDSIKKFIADLLPSWERRTVLACAKISAKAKALAWDLADNPSEIRIDGEVAKAQSVLKETWNVPGESKLRFLLGLLEREKPERVCVFCNLKDTAEEVSRRLEANGVGSDFILGALAIERKLSVLDKVVSGACPVLVLTDQGAEGLDGGSFPLVVNYDIPLEPEFFVKRIEMLDRADPGAKVVSLACDRYIYGLPAVESHIDAKLDALPSTEAQLSAVDKSEGMSFEKKQRREEARQGEGRRAQSQGKGRSEGQGRQRRDSYPRDSRSRDGYPRDAYSREDRSPDIRKSISEATGGTLDMSGRIPPVEAARAQGDAGRRQPARGPSDQGKRGGRKPDPQRGENRGGEGRRGGDRGKGKQQQTQRPQPPRAQGPRQAAPRPTSSSGPANPYDIPIEERMKQYREKYGRGLGTEKRGSSQRRAQPKPASQESSPPRAQPKPQSAPPESKPEGLLGHLFGAFKKKNP
jgi:ATP-dependent RNA helicase RhlB